MDEPLETLRRVAETIPTPSPDIEGVRRTARRRSTRRRITAGGVALLVAAAGLAFVVGALRDTGPQPVTPATPGSLDPTTLRYAWSVEIEDASAVSEVVQDDDRIYVPTATGAVAYPKTCTDPCRPVWMVDLVEARTEGIATPSVALSDGVLAIAAGGRLAVVSADCGSAGAVCQPLWYAEPPRGSSSYSGAGVADGVVKVTTNVGNAPDNTQTAVAFDLHCRDDGGECQPLWRGNLGSGPAYYPAPAVNGVFYQQVGTVMTGFAARCGSDGELCTPDFVVQSMGDPQSEQSVLLGPIVQDETVIVTWGGGSLLAYPEHCGTSCQPVWSVAVAEFLDTPPMVAGNNVVISYDGALTALPLACGGGSPEETCSSDWTARLDGYWTVDYADGNAVVAATRLGGLAAIAVLPANCDDPCRPMWMAEPGVELHGVTSDGSSVFASTGRRLVAYPLACADPCAPLWSADLDADAWSLLVDDRYLIATSQQGPVGTTGLKVTVYSGQPRTASEGQAEGSAQYELRNVHLDDVVTEDDGTLTALVSYEIAWSGDEWPGYMDCRVDIVDAEGTTIATQEFERMSTRPRPPPDVIAVAVPSGDPADVEISCGEAHRPSESAAYVITDPVVVGTAGDVRMAFDVAWITEEPPLYQGCQAELQRADGTIGNYLFGLSVPPGRAEILLPAGFAGASVLDVSCLPYRTPDDVEASTDDMLSVDPMPQSILENASTELIPEWQRRVREWAAEIGAEGMSDQALVDTMDVLTQAITRSFLANDDWVGERELMMRRTYICGLLPADHKYRGGEYCE